MKIRGLVFASFVVALAMAGFAFVTADRLPAGAVLPTHWNAAGEADDFSPALEALLLPAGMVLLIAALFAFIPRLEPLQDKLAGSAPVLRASWIGILFLFTLIELTIGLPAYGIDLPVNIIMLGVGVLMVVLGNALPKSRPGFFVGIRTPWAILDTDNWVATHRLGGKLMLLAGIAIIIGALLLPPQWQIAVTLASVLIAAFVPFLYSWWLWERTKTDRKGA